MTWRDMTGGRRTESDETGQFCRQSSQFKRWEAEKEATEKKEIIFNEHSLLFSIDVYLGIREAIWTLNSAHWTNLKSDLISYITATTEENKSQFDNGRCTISLLCTISLMIITYLKIIVSIMLKFKELNFSRHGFEVTLSTTPAPSIDDAARWRNTSLRWTTPR